MEEHLGVVLVVAHPGLYVIIILKGYIQPHFYSSEAENRSSSNKSAAQPCSLKRKNTTGQSGYRRPGGGGAV